MKINLKYFGLVSEIAKTNEEFLDIGKQASSEDLSRLLEEKYNNLYEVDYRMAINKTLINKSVELAENDTVAILPPFSGG